MREALRLKDIHNVVLHSNSKYRWDLWHKAWIMNAAPRNDHDDALEPVLDFPETCVRDMKAHEDATADFKCPRCGCDVGEIYLPKMHIQGDDHFCADCGQRIDWKAASLKYERRNS